MVLLDSSLPVSVCAFFLHLRARRVFLSSFSRMAAAVLTDRSPTPHTHTLQRSHITAAARNNWAKRRRPQLIINAPYILLASLNRWTNFTLVLYLSYFKYSSRVLKPTLLVTFYRRAFIGQITAYVRRMTYKN